MTLARKHVCLALLMAVLIGHFGMAVHATTHVMGEAGECELCLSYNNVADALPNLPEPGVVPARESADTARAHVVSEKRQWAPFLQRDPPGSD